MHITEEQVIRELSVPQCIEVLRAALATDYINIPRYRLKSPGGHLQVMSASVPALGVMGLKAYGTSRQGAGSFAVLLFEEQTGRLLADFEADALGQIRTGAASGLATDLLAAPEARTGAVIGTGYQAETQLLAIDAVRKFDEIRIYSRSAEKRASFVAKMQGRVRARLVETDSARACAVNADVICTITTSRDPVLSGGWLKQGCHINAAGSNAANRSELDQDAVERCDVVCVDQVEQGRIESGDLITALASWDHVIELRELLRGTAPGRTNRTQITLFKSNGIAAEDVAAAHFVYQRLSAGH